MDLEEIIKELSLWDKWTYNYLSGEFIGFTCNYIGVSEKGDTFEDRGYKPKVWIKASRVMLIPVMLKLHNNFTLNNTFFIETILISDDE